MKRFISLVASLAIMCSVFVWAGATAAEPVTNVNNSQDEQVTRSFTRDRSVGLGPGSGEHEVLSDGNWGNENLVVVSLKSTQGPNPVKVRVYRETNGVYEFVAQKNVTFGSALSCNVGGADFKVTAEYVSGSSGNCTLTIALS